MASTFFLIALGFVIGLGGWALFLWAVRSGQFDDAEAPKYRMLDDDDEVRNKPKKKSGNMDK
ncbi:cbb3-type cytochrome oxidase assembly protein CcoS [Chlorobaculum thiosulfatiphilum]|jgi:cbb3-type cytochrome oxidase maturation protein|uniref:Cbb3-type cytochrome oxidase assembly protein CcoS n=1 Tax=Chlorobaculum thiosulfatiphilum TaxID=115852 RepID=A0A5C4S9L7_CHLTI|nr:cbb3-type cytochrome oxidase assembly protein CcoS [Chlorobaculum thiosulfatiphilum]TNJ39848.1 cbb3-type cytochrome oxidase assembly protein CcoS [Chlorobaculum thiosulfatiphilum]